MDLVQQLEVLTTEAVNPRTADIDLLDARQIVELLNAEDAGVATAVQAVLEPVAIAATMLAQTIMDGKRMVYVGAGTSGRLGILDASEIPPTYGADPGLITGIIAGGYQAILKAVEGAEDDRMEGGFAVSALRESDERDVGMIVGMSASGRTPFVLGALEYGARNGMFTVLVSTNNPDWLRAQAPFVNLLICPQVGPEPITGSTRMKSGTAQKMIVNMITTSAMVMLGKTYGNVMIDLKPTNQKLQARMIRIVSMLGNCSVHEAQTLLEAASWNTKTAIVAAYCRCTVAEAEVKLRRENGRVRSVVTHFNEET